MCIRDRTAVVPRPRSTVVVPRIVGRGRRSDDATGARLGAARATAARATAFVNMFLAMTRRANGRDARMSDAATVRSDRMGNELNSRVHASGRREAREREETEKNEPEDFVKRERAKERERVKW